MVYIEHNYEWNNYLLKKIIQKRDIYNMNEYKVRYLEDEYK